MEDTVHNGLATEQGLRQDFVSIEPAAVGVEVRGEEPDGSPALVVIPWEQAVQASHRILQLARDREE